MGTEEREKPIGGEQQKKLLPSTKTKKPRPKGDQGFGVTELNEKNCGWWPKNVNEPGRTTSINGKKKPIFWEVRPRKTARETLKKKNSF